MRKLTALAVPSWSLRIPSGARKPVRAGIGNQIILIDPVATDAHRADELPGLIIQRHPTREDRDAVTERAAVDPHSDQIRSVRSQFILEPVKWAGFTSINAGREILLTHESDRPGGESMAVVAEECCRPRFLDGDVVTEIGGVSHPEYTQDVPCSVHDGHPDPRLAPFGFRMPARVATAFATAPEITWLTSCTLSSGVSLSKTGLSTTNALSVAPRLASSPATSL